MQNKFVIVNNNNPTEWCKCAYDVFIIVLIFKTIVNQRREILTNVVNYYNNILVQLFVFILIADIPRSIELSVSTSTICRITIKSIRNLKKKEMYIL